MSSEVYSLQIIQAVDLPFTKRKHLPDAYVEVRLGGFEYKTKVVKQCRNPSWNEDVLITANSKSLVLSLDVKHKSGFPFSSNLIGHIHAKIGDLLDQCNGNKEVELDLSTEDLQHPSHGNGRIRILFCTPTSDVAAAVAVTGARNDASIVADGNTATAREYVTSVQTTIAPTSGTLDGLGAVFSKIDVFVKIVDQTASVHPYAKLAWQIVSSVYKIVRNQVTTDQKLIELVATMEMVYSFVDSIQSDVTGKVKVLEETIKRIFTQTVECAIFIREFANHGFADRTIRGMVKDDAGTIERLSQGLMSLKKDFDTGIAVQIVIVSFRTHENVATILRKQTLLELAPAEMDASGRTECLPSTRQDILSEIVLWATDPSCSQNVRWIHGLAGSGKSTLSTTVANYFRDLHRLGGFLFLDCAFPERSHPSKVIRTLAYKLGSFDLRIGTAICAAMDSFPSVNDAPLRVQFTKLLLEPLASLTVLKTEGPIVLVLDALDECGDSAEREVLLTLFGEELARLPSIFRVLITSRRLDDIAAALGSQEHILAQNLPVSLETSGRDILSYFEYQFGTIRKKKAWLPPGWPGNEVVRDLQMRSCGLFVWASTVAKFVDSFSPEKRLAVILRGEIASGAQSAIDHLYKTALEDACAWDDDDFVEGFRTVLEVILVLQSPLETSTLDRLIGLPEDQASSRAISALACVVAQEPTVHLLHPSFADFLLSRTRCGRDVWHFNAAICHRHLALKCLERLSNNGLKRNICNLALHAALKSEKVPDDVAYACKFWTHHVCFINDDVPPVVARIETFLKEHLLHWFEVMAILGRSGDTITLLDSLYVWVAANSDQRNLLEFIRDALRFAQNFQESIREHPLLVYSALPFTPTTSTIYKIFHDTQTYPTVSGGFQRSWSNLLLVLSRPRESFHSVAFSPDGARIVSGAIRAVCIWDATSGTEVIPPLEEHNSTIASVAFSPDCSRIVIGLRNTVHLWDAMSGVEVISPLEGHNSVTSVALSPDGTRIVSGSKDNTVRIWDALSGSEVIPMLQGHKDSVSSVVFSPDGTRVVSGSRDHTVRVWDAMSGAEVIPPLEGHDNWVTSVAFSPDGTRIVSGSTDYTVRVWDALSGTEVIPPLQHDSSVYSIAISRDGTRVASGSYNNTVHIWDAMSGTEVMPPLQGHGSSVNSVAFSPDGTRIVSGSDDSTVRVWDVTPSAEATPPLRGHNGRVWKVVFSPDGTRVASTSEDDTVRVWDIVSGTEVIPPLQHDALVCSVAFSSDGTRIVSGSGENRIPFGSGSNVVRIWDALSGTSVIPPCQGHKGFVDFVAFFPDGTRVVSSSSSDETVRVWDTMSGTEVIPPLQDDASISSVALSSDGTRIVSGSGGGNVCIWDALSGTGVIPPLRGHKGQVHRVAFSLDGTRVVSCATDHTVRVWDAVSGAEVIPPLQHDSFVFSIAISADGTRVGSRTDSKFYVWDAITGLPKPSSGAQDESSVVLDGPMITSKGWVVDIYSNRTICKLPAIIQCSGWVSSGKSLAIGTTAGRVLVLNIPLAMFSNPEARSADARTHIEPEMLGS